MNAKNLRFALIGSGAVGSSLGSDLVAAGFDVTFFDPWWHHVEAIKSNGLTVNVPTGSATHHIDAHHLHEVAETKRQFDVVFTAVKAYDTRWACELAKPLMREDSVLVGLQNGMTIDESSEILGAERSMGCVLGIAANLPEPGVVNREFDSSETWLSVGEVTGDMSDRLKDVHEALSHTAQVEMTADIRSAKWMKLLANIPEMLPSGILGLPLLDAAQAPGVRAVMDQMSREAYALAEALGITFQPTLGLTQDDVIESDEYAVGLLDVILTSYSRPSTRVAVLQDWEKGRRAEIDAFSGYIVRESEKQGIDAPVNRAVVNIARQIEAGKLRPSPDNRSLFLEAWPEAEQSGAAPPNSLYDRERESRGE